MLLSPHDVRKFPVFQKIHYDTRNLQFTSVHPFSVLWISDCAFSVRVQVFIPCTESFVWLFWFAVRMFFAQKNDRLYEKTQNQRIFIYRTVEKLPDFQWNGKISIFQKPDQMIQKRSNTSAKLWKTFRGQMFQNKSVFSSLEYDRKIRTNSDKTRCRISENPDFCVFSTRCTVSFRSNPCFENSFLQAFFFLLCAVFPFCRTNPKSRCSGSFPGRMFFRAFSGNTRGMSGGLPCDLFAKQLRIFG